MQSQTVETDRAYRMKDLCRQTGLSRQAIHYYIQQGLLPEGEKRGRNMAWYSEEHVERLRIIRKLQSERLLPLKTIRSLLENQPAAAEPHLREMLVELKSRLSGELATSSELETVDVTEAIADLEVTPGEIERMAELGLLTLIVEAGRLRIPRDSVWMLELWSQIRSIGFTEERGFSVDDMLIYEQMVSSLFKLERESLTERLAELPGEQIAEMLQRALPLIHTFLAHYHTAALREYFATIE